MTITFVIDKKELEVRDTCTTKNLPHKKGNTLKFLNIGTPKSLLFSICPKWEINGNIGIPKIFNFPFVPNGKLMVFRCSSIKAHSGIHIKFPTFMDIVIIKVYASSIRIT